EVDRRQRLAEGADLVHLDEDRVRDPGLDPALEALRARDEEVVADELELRSERLRVRAPAVPVVLGEAVLDRDERVLRRPLLVARLEVARRHGALLAREGLALVAAVLRELARGDVEGERDVLAGLPLGRLDRRDQEVERGVVRLELRREA